MNTRVPRTPNDWDQAAKGTPFEGMGATLHRLATRVYCTRCCSIAHNVTYCPYPQKSVDSASKDRQDRPTDTNKVTRFEVIDHRECIWCRGRKSANYVQEDGSYKEQPCDKCDGSGIMGGRVYAASSNPETSEVKIELSYQDDGRTLKVFVGDRKAGDD